MVLGVDNRLEKSKKILTMLGKLRRIHSHGVSRDTLRRWEKAGKIPSEKTVRGHLRYDLFKLLGISRLPGSCIKQQTSAYARVSSHDQKNDLDRQSQVLESFCAANGWTCEIICDLGSGLIFQKRGFKQC